MNKELAIATFISLNVIYVLFAGNITTVENDFNQWRKKFGTPFDIS